MLWEEQGMSADHPNDSDPELPTVDASRPSLRAYNCRNCDAVMMLYPSQAGRLYCSRACQHAHNARTGKSCKPRRGSEVACPQCGGMTYKQPKALAMGYKFCSRACANQFQGRNKVVKHCEYCGVEMRLPPSQGPLRRYCSKECDSNGSVKRPADFFHNGRRARKDPNGYVLIYEPTHPRGYKGWVYQHRFVVETCIGRHLEPSEAVHHINGIKDDNRPENLELMDLTEHAVMSIQDYRKDVRQKLDEHSDMAAKLAEYERRFGPID
jgi:hypothetical protein